MIFANLTPQEATTIHKSIRRNHEAFTDWGHPTAWDWPTLRQAYPELATILREVIARENS